MRSMLLICAFVCVAPFCHAQSAEDSVKAVINKMFDAMRARDGALLQSVFGDSALLQTISRSKEGKTIIRNESIKEFAASVASAPKGSLDERISFESVQTDGSLAAVWTPYSFYYNGKFSHCGVNSFQLVRIDGIWKVQYIIDTRRKTNCVENK
jgi:hypothetical protein